MLTGPLYLRAAGPADAATLTRLRTQAAAWIEREHGSSQWSGPFDARAWIAQGATVMAMLEPDGEPIATGTVKAAGDPRRWTPAELATPAGYLAKLMVDRGHAGRGIGSLLTWWARRHARRGGAVVLRMDVWSDNVALHNYHRANGWRWVRTVPGMTSGALFEIPVVGLDETERRVREVGEIRLPPNWPAARLRPSTLTTPRPGSAQGAPPVRPDAPTRAGVRRRSRPA